MITAVMAAASFLFSAEVPASDFGCSGLQHLLHKAEQGNAVAEGVLGTYYYNGECVKQDYSKAAMWYRKSADHGQLNSLALLGIMYLQGRGVTQNYTEAARLLQKASDQGNTNAMYTLAVMYANGQGFAKDIGRAKELSKNKLLKIQ